MTPNPKKTDPMQPTLQVLALLTEKVGRTVARTFLFVASNEGLAQAEIGKKLGLSQPTVARHLKMLGTQRYMYSNNGRPPEVRTGLGLLEVRHELASYDVRAPYHLTEKGRRLVAGVELLLG